MSRDTSNNSSAVPYSNKNKIHAFFLNRYNFLKSFVKTFLKIKMNGIKIVEPPTTALHQSNKNPKSFKAFLKRSCSFDSLPNAKDVL